MNAERPVKSLANKARAAAVTKAKPVVKPTAPVRPTSGAKPPMKAY